MEVDVERAERDLDRLLGWIRAADSKTGVIFAINTAMLGVLAALVPDPEAWRVAGGAVTALATLLLLSSLVMLACATFPRVDGPRGSLVYFGGIAGQEPDQYLARLRERSAGDHLGDLAAQCHRNAEIASAKFCWIRWAMGAQFLAVVPWVVAVYSLYSAA